MKEHIAKMLAAQKGRHISFHTPGHKRRGADITELSYSDNLAAPRGVLAAAQADCARILGADASFFLTDGSTSGVYSMLLALRRAGAARVAVPVCSHVSVLRGCELAGLVPVPVPQEWERGIARQPSLSACERALSAADALLVTSPDYYGYFPDLRGLAALCAREKKPLLADGAHGSHLHGTPMYAGNFADMWVDGVHKSLPALTQGAVVSAKGAWAARLEAAVPYFRTTSPSYPILSSIEHAVKFPRSERTERAAAWAKAALGAEPNDDWSKIVLPFGEKSGAARACLEARGLYPEFDDGNYLMFYLSPASRVRDIKTLVRLAKRLPRGEVRGAPHEKGSCGQKTAALPPEAALGRTCAQTCGLFPPCVPVLLRGERVDEDAVRRLSGALSAFGLEEGKIVVFED